MKGGVIFRKIFISLAKVPDRWHFEEIKLTKCARLSKISQHFFSMDLFIISIKLPNALPIHSITSKIQLPGCANELRES
jgi:hypothetical protein